MTSQQAVRPTTGFVCRVRRGPSVGGVLLELDGELDLATAPLLEREIIAAEVQSPSMIVVDLRGLTFMDAAGLHVLLRAEARRPESGVRFTVIRGGRRAMRICEVTGLDEQLPLVDHATHDLWAAAPSA